MLSAIAGLRQREVVQQAARPERWATRLYPQSIDLANQIGSNGQPDDVPKTSRAPRWTAHLKMVEMIRPTTGNSVVPLYPHAEEIAS